MFLKENRINPNFFIGNLFNLYSTVPIENLLETLQKNLNLDKISGVQTELAKDAIAKIRSLMLLDDEGKAEL
jgi:hypothetical protein